MMRMEFEHSAWLLALVVLPGVLLVLRYTLIDNPWLQRAISAFVRMVIIALLIFALAQSLWVTQSKDVAVLVLADMSDSVSGTANEQLHTFLDELEKRVSNPTKAGLVVFASAPQTLLPVSYHPEFPEEIQKPEDGRNETSIAKTLSYAWSMMPSGTINRIVLFSDGNETGGDALAEAKRGAGQGFQVYTMPYQADEKSEVLLEDLIVPPEVKKGQSFTVTAVAHAVEDTSASFTLYRLEGLVKYIMVKLEESPNDLEFRDLLAETYLRMNQTDKAEAEYQYILERDPRKAAVYEKMIALFARTEQKAKEVQAYEKLIEMYPNESEYIRRLGEMHMRDGEPDDAKAAWNRLTEKEPTAARWTELAGWLEDYDFMDEAVEAYRHALESGPNKEWSFRLASLQFQRGEEDAALEGWLSVLNGEGSAAEIAEVAAILEVNQFTDKAIELQESALEKDESNLDLRLAYAKNLMRKERYEDALQEFDTLATQNENEYFQDQGESGRLDAYSEMGILEQKQQEWEAELNRNPDSVETLTKLARIYERAGQREKAVELYERRLSLQEDNSDYMRTLADMYKGSKMIDQSIEMYQKLIGNDKNRARVYYKDLLDIYLGVDLKDEAIAAAEKIVELAPSDPEARIELAQVYGMYQQTEDALQQYRYALRLEPNEPDYHRSYGEALAMEKRYGEAQEAFRKMMDTSEEEATRISAVESLANIYLQQNNIDELIGEFQRRIRSTPKKLAAYDELASVYKVAGQVFRSVEILENALQNVDDQSEALKKLIRVSFEAQDFIRVRNYYEQLIAMSGKPSPFEYERLGRIYAQLGDIEKAKDTWAKIVESAPDDPKAYDQLSKIYQDEGYSDEALAMKARAVELDEVVFVLWRVLLYEFQPGYQSVAQKPASILYGGGA